MSESTGFRPEWRALGDVVALNNGTPLGNFHSARDAELAVACVNACKKTNPTMVPVAFGALEAINACAIESLTATSDAKTKNIELMGALFAMLPKLLNQLHSPAPKPTASVKTGDLN